MMDHARQHANDSLPDLPDALLYKIFCECSIVGKVRAEAACQTFRKLGEFRNLCQALYFPDNVEVPALPRTTNIDKLKVTLGTFYAPTDAAKVYQQLQMFMKNTKQGGVMYLSGVQELELQHHVETPSHLRLTSQKLLQELLLILPCLRTLCVGSVCGSRHFLARDGPQPLSSVRRLFLELAPHPKQLVRLPTLLPNLDTLCLKTCGGHMNASWLQPLSQMSNVQYLSLRVNSAQQNTLPDMHQISSLRHLKLNRCSSDKQWLSGLHQLDSLTLTDAYPRAAELAALSVLNVTSLSLQHVTPSPSWGQDTSMQQDPEAKHWSKLTRVNMGSDVSELVLQALLLPSPNARGLKVQLRSGAFDDFAQVNEQFSPRSRSVYVADATPVLGPAYFEAARVSVLAVRGNFCAKAVEAILATNVRLEELDTSVWPFGLCEAGVFALPALHKLAVPSTAQMSEDGWCNLFLHSPCLREVEFWGTPHMQDISNMKAAACRVGATIVGCGARVYTFIRC